MAFAIEVCRIAGMKEHVLYFWFGRRGEGARKARLHGWRLWHAYCVENDYSVRTMTDPGCNPEMMLAEFMIDMDRQGVKDYRIREARLAVFELFEFVQGDKFPRIVAGMTHGLLKQVSAALTSKVNRAPRYHDIWPLGVLLRFIRSDSPAESLSGSELMARTAALSMIFISCRPLAMTRMDCARARWAEKGHVLIILAKERMDRGKGYTELVLRRIDNESLYPPRHYLLLERRARRLGAGGSLFCSEDGKPYAQSAQLSKLLKQLLLKAGINRKYPAYSIRHALITALLDAGLSESQVDAYTGHSNNAHTAAIT
jgi:hypothetical protein